MRHLWLSIYIKRVLKEAEQFKSIKKCYFSATGDRQNYPHRLPSSMTLRTESMYNIFTIGMIEKLFKEDRKSFRCTLNDSSVTRIECRLAQCHLGTPCAHSIPHTLASGYPVDSAPFPESPFPSGWRNRFINIPPFKRFSIQRSTTHCTESTEEQGQPYPVLTSSLPASLIQRQQLCRWGLSHGNR